MCDGQPVYMPITYVILANVLLDSLAIAGVARVMLLARRLPAVAPHQDESWGLGGDPWIASDPLPVRELVRHEYERERERAA
jgi:hypothetical protein